MRPAGDTILAAYLLQQRRAYVKLASDLVYRAVKERPKLVKINGLATRHAVGHTGVRTGVGGKKATGDTEQLLSEITTAEAGRAERALL